VVVESETHRPEKPQLIRRLSETSSAGIQICLAAGKGEKRLVFGKETIIIRNETERRLKEKEESTG